MVINEGTKTLLSQEVRQDMAETIRKFESCNIFYPVNHCGLVKTNDISEYQPSLEELEKTAEMIRSEIRDQ